MPAAGSLVVLMKEWPLNSAMLSTATHSKLREALDGTNTQVATCAIDRWTAKMKGAKRIYNQRDLTNRREGNSEDTRKLYWWSIRRGEEELILGRGPRTDFDPLPQLRRWRSCSPTILPNHWRSSRKGPVLKPASLPNSLYWAYWVWVRSHLQ